MFFSSMFPYDYGAGGIFQHCAKSGTMAAGLASASPVYSFRWPATLVAAITRVRLSAWTLGTAFGGGVATFDLFAARAYTALDSGGTLISFSGEQSQLRSTMSQSQAQIVRSATATLTPGTRVLDNDPLNSVTLTAPTTSNQPFTAAGSVSLLDKQLGDHPLTLVQNEGFVINATVPGTGTWGFSVTTEWTEMSIDVLRGLGS
jgi:hypothetical protein